MTGFLLSIDQGTTGSTALLRSPDGQVLGRANQEFPQHFPRPGWVEHDVEEIWASVAAAVTKAVEEAGVRASDCLGIGITNQRETTVVWDRNTGKAVHNAIVLEEIARMAYHTLQLNKVDSIDKHLLDKHYLRKHGSGAYYGQQ